MAREKKKAIKRSKSDVIFDGVIFVILTFILLIVAYPLYFIIISSFSSPEKVSSGQVIFYPLGFTLEGYKKVFENDQVITGFINSLIYTTVGTCINLLLTIPTAFALSKRKFQGRKFVTIFYMITMFIGGGMIPTYLVVQKLGLLDSMWALILPGSLSVYNMIVARTFFQQNISEELYEAAELDGCGHGRFFFNIALPLSKAIIAIMVLYYGVGHWNSYFNALLYMQTEEKYPLQLVLRSILVQNSAQLSQTVVSAAQQEAVELMKYSLIIISSIPVLILYPFIQRHFTKGVMIGSVKG